MKRQTVKSLAGFLAGTLLVAGLVGCGTAGTDTTDTAATAETTETTEVQAEPAAEETTEAAADTTADAATETVTYEFDTYDGEHVVIDGSNLTLQEKCDDPNTCDKVPADAEDVAPGRDYAYKADADNFYVLDFVNNMVTVAPKAAAVKETADTAQTDPADQAVVDVATPGTLEGEDYTVTYDPTLFYAYTYQDDPETGYVNYQGDCAGTCIIIFEKSSAADVDAALAEIENTEALKNISDYDFNGYAGKTACNDAPAGTGADNPIIDNVYTVFEANGSVYVITQSVTRDPDDDRAMEMADRFLDVINTFTLK